MNHLLLLVAIAPIAMAALQTSAYPLSRWERAGARLPAETDEHRQDARVTTRENPPAASKTQSTPPARIRRMRVTAYCPCSTCCGPHACGVTASGQPVTVDSASFVAADARLAFGVRVIVPGYAGDQPVRVLDRGGAIKGDRLDVFFSSHQAAREWGVRWLDVTILDSPAR